MSGLEGKDKQNLKWRFKVSRFQIWIDKVIWKMSTLEVPSSDEARTNSKNLKLQAFKVSSFQGFKFEVTKSHGKYQHSKC